MTISPKWGMWISIAAAIISALVLCGTQFTTIFGDVATAKILASLAILNAVINGTNAVLHMIPSQRGPVGAAEFPLGPPAIPKAVALLAILVLGTLLIPTTGYAQTKRPAFTGRPIEDIQAGIKGTQATANTILTNVGTDVSTFLTNLAAIPDAIALSSAIPGLQDPVGNACWTQFGPLGELIKTHPLVVSGKAAADLEALRLAAIGLNQICANPNCGQMFVDATNAASAIGGNQLNVSLQSLCSKVPVIGTSAVPTANAPTAGVGTVATPTPVAVPAPVVAPK
jgi:hypothetical protein